MGKAEGTTRLDSTRLDPSILRHHVVSRECKKTCRTLRLRTQGNEDEGERTRTTGFSPKCKRLEKKKRRKRPSRGWPWPWQHGGACSNQEEYTRNLASVALAAALFVGAGAETLVQQPPSALAELNAREYERGGEFNRGSAMQFGGVDMKKVDIVKEFGKDLRLSNFVQADIRDAKLKQANLRGAHMMKLVAPGVDF